MGNNNSRVVSVGIQIGRLSNSSADIRAQAVSSLASSALNAEELGVLMGYLHKMATPIRRSTSIVLLNFSRSLNDEELFIQENLIYSILSATQKETDSKVLCNLLEVLANLSLVSKGYHVAIRSKDAVLYLISILSHKLSDIRCASAKVIANLALDESSRAIIGKTSNVITLLKALVNDRDEDSASQSVRAIGNLSLNNSNAKQIFKLKVEYIIISRLPKLSMNARKQFIAALANLASNSCSRPEVYKHISSLMPFLSDHSSEIKAGAARLFGNIAYDVNYIKRIKKIGAYIALTGLLTDPDSTVRAEAAWAQSMVDSLPEGYGKPKVMLFPALKFDEELIESDVDSSGEDNSVEDLERREPSYSERKEVTQSSRDRSFSLQEASVAFKNEHLQGDESTVGDPESDTTYNNKIAEHELGFDALKELLGQGAFADVYKTIWQNTYVAIKCLKQTASGAALEGLLHEADIMVQLRHPNVMIVYGFCLELTGLVMKFMPGGSLYDLLHNRKEPTFDWRKRLDISKDVAQGLCFLHKHDICHRDIKSSNVMLDLEKKAVLSDFGSSLSTSQFQDAGIVGTVSWIAPELLATGGANNEGGHSGGLSIQDIKRCDIYSFGVLLWEVATRKNPFQNVISNSIIRSLVVKGQRENIPKTVPDYFSSLIKSCWAQLPGDRPLVGDVVDRLGMNSASIVKI